MRKIKLFVLIFLSVFIFLFLVFNGVAFFSVVRYKIKNLVFLIKEEINRPPLFLVRNQPLFTGLNSMPSLNNLKKSLNNSQNLDLLKPSLINYHLLKLKKPLISYKVNTLILPKFEIEAPIIKVTEFNSKLIYENLKKGVVLYPGSSDPGKGYSIILGHSSQYPWQPGRYKSVFSLLNELNKGDFIYIVWENKLLVFEVKDKKIFLPWPKGQETTESVFPPTNEKIVILQSCWPVGVASKRVAVKTVLVLSN